MTPVTTGKRPCRCYSSKLSEPIGAQPPGSSGDSPAAMKTRISNASRAVDDPSQLTSADWWQIAVFGSPALSRSTCSTSNVSTTPLQSVSPRLISAAGICRR